MNGARVTVAVLVVAGLASCSSGSAQEAGPAAAPGAVKAGAPAAALHVVMGDSQPADAPTGVAMQEFAARVEELSHGAIQVETRSAGALSSNHGDAAVVAALTSGDLQLATVPTRAWSDAGVQSTDVLQAPFEVESNAHMAAVAADATLVRTALSGLESKGAHGLALVPERLRVIVGFDTPVTDPADLRGGNFRTFSASIGTIVSHLGAIRIDPTDEEYADLRARGAVRATETDWSRAQGLAFGAVASADLVLYAKFVSIAANARWWKELSDQQRTVFEQAANQTRENLQSTVPSVSDEATTFCNAGGSVVLAGSAALQRFRTALEAVTRAVDQTALAALRADRPAQPPQQPEACAPATDGLDPTKVTPAAGPLPNGTYRLEWTEAFARQWNAKGSGLRFEGNDAVGTFKVITLTWRLKDGHYTFEIIHDSGRPGEPFTVSGIYQVKGDQMLLALHPDIGNVVNRLRWRVNPDRSLTLTQIDGFKADPYYGLRWTRIGDA
ncbi:MAG: TRAP transporter substrate-binding protein DctP [Dermatophilaceae bacterium]